MIKVDDAYEAFASLLNLVAKSGPKKKGIHPEPISGGLPTYAAGCIPSFSDRDFATRFKKRGKSLIKHRRPLSSGH